ncbi:MAG: hypothetical protein Q9207_006988 [Kuettlingeria erythrocarpa]
MAHRNLYEEHNEKAFPARAAKAPSKDLRKWDDIPSWQQDNEYILSGYRESTGSFARSFRSLLYVHNETVNIYSHLLAAAFFLSAPIYLYEIFYADYLRATRGDVIVFSTFFYGVGEQSRMLQGCIPEKWSPYKFDILGSSHQMLHVAVILAGLAHMFGLFRAFRNLHSGASACTWAEIGLAGSN